MIVQTVTITLSDGRRVTYTGRAQIAADDVVTVTDVSVSAPIELGVGYEWHTVTA